MSEENRYALCDEALEELLLAAADGEESGLNQLTIILKMAQPKQSDQWPPEVQTFWSDNLEMVVEQVNPANIHGGDGLFLEALLVAGFDSLLFRDRLATYFKHLFSSYRDPAGLLSVLGVRDRSLPLATISRRYQMLQQIKPGAYCYDRQAGMGTILQLDDIANELSVQFERRLTVPLERFLQYFIVVKDLSFLHRLLSNKSTPPEELANLLANTRSSLLTMMNLETEQIEKMLVPKVFSKEKYRRILSAEAAMTKAGASDAAELPAFADQDAAATDGRASELERWDASRSLLELSERLKSIDSLELASAPDTANIDRILQFGASSSAQAELFALALAQLQKLAGEQLPWLQERIAAVATPAVVWQKPMLFAQIADKIPARLLPFWLRVTAIAKGVDYLAAQTLYLPARLWPQVEKILLEFSAADLLLAKVSDHLKAGKLSADLLFWIWRSSHQDLKDTYLGDASLLFKMLGVSVKGSYLKAQRDLKRLLLNDEKFQRQVMLHGQREAVLALIRSVRQVPLLDSSERQSLLVKIVRLYPEYNSLVEERAAVVPRRSVKKMTSARSYQLRCQELETLINELIPANIKALEEARAHGDLRENSEYKYAKEQQQFLANRRVELEESLTDIQMTDFRDVAVEDTVVPGSQIVLALPEGKLKTYYLLGLFDSNPELGMISYDAPVGKLLLGCQVDDQLQLPSGEMATVVKVNQLPEEILALLAD